MVEIDRLLVVEFSIDLDRSAYRCGSLSHPPTIDELFAVCLKSVNRALTLATLSVAIRDD
jgi:hypothetical protein